MAHLHSVPAEYGPGSASMLATCQCTPQETAQVVGSLACRWEAQIEHSDPSFRLCKPQVLQAFGGAEANPWVSS